MKGKHVSMSSSRFWRQTSIASTFAVGLALFLCATLIFSATALALPLPDPSLWSPSTVVNPSLLRPVPVVGYDPATGILYLDNLGVDRVSNTAGGTSIGGDDVGTISLLIRGPEPTNAIAPFTNGNFDMTNLILWSYQYFGGRAQLIGTATPSGQFIRPGSNNILQYAPGLTQADFQDVEMGINFEAMQTGETIFGSVQFVPEPLGWLVSPMFLLVTAVLCQRQRARSRVTLRR